MDAFVSGKAGWDGRPIREIDPDVPNNSEEFRAEPFPRVGLGAY
jgi:hypothetical protein